MLKKQIRSSRGFTLVEIMIVVAIIALLAAIAVPNFLRARKRSQATHIMNDLRMLDNAIDQYAIDTAKLAGFNPAFADLQNYLKTDTNLYSTGNDIFGDSYGPFTVDSVPIVPTSAFNVLSDVADASFWPPYYPAGGGSSVAEPAALAAATQALSAEQASYNSILATYNADMAANIGGQPRKTITAEMTAATQALAAAQAAYSAAGGQ